MPDTDLSAELQAAVIDAYDQQRPMEVVGGGSKSFYGRECTTPNTRPLSVSDHRGVVSYEPSELVLTARAGTPLEEIENVLRAQNQYLPFDPPQFSSDNGPATLGGAIAAGLAGPRRPYTGAPRDLILGVRMLNGRGENLRFGGEVMKNVAGYDISRLMAGSLGTLGVLLEVSVKVLPSPPAEATWMFELTETQALTQLLAWGRKPYPISGTFHTNEQLFIRLSGSEAGVEAASRELGGERSEIGDLWTSIRDQTHSFFRNTSHQTTWRLALPDGIGPLTLEGPTALEWGGTQRWLVSSAPTEVIRKETKRYGGHATLFRGTDRTGDVFQPLAPELLRIHMRMKNAFDPARIFNPGRMYAGL